MICPECNGKGEVIYYVETDRDENTVTVAQRKGICRTCNGSGVKAQTNEDRILAIGSEKLADALYEACVCRESCTGCPAENCHPHCPGENHDAWVEWLKQPAEVDGNA